MSDRGGRGDTRHGSDWLIAKSHDTFAPMGPFIVPKEFVPDPQKLKVTFKLNGQVMQDANTSLMIHTVFEQVSYASHILTLRPGDVIATGSPAGVGSARNPPIFLKAGDISECTYEGVGTLRNPVAEVSQTGPPCADAPVLEDPRIWGLSRFVARNCSSRRSTVTRGGPPTAEPARPADQFAAAQ